MLSLFKDSAAPMKAGLSVQELKQLTAHRIAQTQDHRVRGTPDVSPVTSPPTRDQFSSSDYVSNGSSRIKLQNSPSLTSLPCDPYVPTESSTAPSTRLHNPSLQSTRLRPVQTPSNPPQEKKPVLPHGLTVQELKELTRMRLAREAIPEPSPVSVPQAVPLTSSRRKSSSSLHAPLSSDSPLLTSQSYRLSGASTPLSEYSDETTTSSDRTAPRRQAPSPMPAAPPLVAATRRPPPNPILRSTSEEFSRMLSGTPEMPKKQQQVVRTPLCDEYDSTLFPNLESSPSPESSSRFKGSKINTNVSYGRDRSNSEVGSLAYEVAESVLLTPTPNSPITPKFSTKAFLDKSEKSTSNKERALVGILLQNTDSQSDGLKYDDDAFVVSGKHQEGRVNFFLPSIGDHHY